MLRASCDWDSQVYCKMEAQKIKIKMQPDCHLQSRRIRSHPASLRVQHHHADFDRRVQDRCSLAPASPGNSVHRAWIGEDSLYTRKMKRVSQRERLWGQRRRTGVPELQKTSPRPTRSPAFTSNSIPNLNVSLRKRDQMSSLCFYSCHQFEPVLSREWISVCLVFV